VLSIVNCLFVCLALNLTSSKRFKSTNSYTRGLFEIFYFFQFIMGPSFLEGGPIMYRIDAVRLSVRPSVCLSVPCLHLEGKRKGLGRPNLVGRVPGTRAPRGPISRFPAVAWVGRPYLKASVPPPRGKTKKAYIYETW